MRYEKLERRDMFAVLDFLPGPESSNVTLHRQVDDTIYLSADTADGSRLLAVTGDHVTDLGLGLGQHVWRESGPIAIEDDTVVTIDLGSGDRTLISDRPGARVLLDDTIYWLDEAPGRTRYDDVDGRSYEYSGAIEEMRDYTIRPLVVVDGALVAHIQIAGEQGGYACTEACIRLGDAALDTGLIVRGNAYIDVHGREVATRDEIAIPSEHGHWFVSGQSIVRVDDGIRIVAGQFDGRYARTAYVSDDQLVFLATSDLWGAEPWSATRDSVSFLGNWTFGRQSTFLAAAESPTGLMVISHRDEQWQRKLWLGDTLGPIAPDAIATDYYYQVRYTEEHGDELHFEPKVAGDSNYDGIFDSADLIQLFQLGEYEDDIAGNSTWETGDFNGDLDFDSADIVAAFQTGRYA